jgi:hypothetical protein
LESIALSKKMILHSGCQIEELTSSLSLVRVDLAAVFQGFLRPSTDVDCFGADSIAV